MDIGHIRRFGRMTRVDEVKATSRATHRYPAGIVTAAAGLGASAFVADVVEGMAGQVLVALTSSGFAWGLAAFLAGLAAPDRRRAIVGPTALLALSTLLYYLLVLLVSRRWSGAYLEDGTSADLQGLVSIELAATLWFLGSIIAGPILGLMGHLVRAGTATTGALALGITCGLLSGEGWHDFIVTGPWQMSTDPQHADFVRGILVSELFRIVIPVAVLAWLMLRHRLVRAWSAIIAATVASTALSIVLWSCIRLATSGA